MNYFQKRLEGNAWFPLLLLLLKKLDTQVDFTEEELAEIEKEYTLFGSFIPETGKYRLTAITKEQERALDECNY